MGKGRYRTEGEEEPAHSARLLVRIAPLAACPEAPWPNRSLVDREATSGLNLQYCTFKHRPTGYAKQRPSPRSDGGVRRGRAPNLPRSEPRVRRSTAPAQRRLFDACRAVESCGLSLLVLLLYYN